MSVVPRILKSACLFSASLLPGLVTATLCSLVTQVLILRTVDLIYFCAFHRCGHSSLAGAKLISSVSISATYLSFHLVDTNLNAMCSHKNSMKPILIFVLIGSVLGCFIQQQKKNNNNNCSNNK